MGEFRRVRTDLQRPDAIVQADVAAIYATGSNLVRCKRPMTCFLLPGFAGLPGNTPFSVRAEEGVCMLYDFGRGCSDANCMRSLTRAEAVTAVAKMNEGGRVAFLLLQPLLLASGQAPGKHPDLAACYRNTARLRPVRITEQKR